MWLKAYLELTDNKAEFFEAEKIVNSWWYMHTFLDKFDDLFTIEDYLFGMWYMGYFWNLICCAIVFTVIKKIKGSSKKSCKLFLDKLWFAHHSRLSVGDNIWDLCHCVHIYKDNKAELSKKPISWEIMICSPF